jgi:hypothetical protein
MAAVRDPPVGRNYRNSIEASLGSLEGYQQRWYREAGQNGQAQDLNQILTSLITLCGLLVATSYPAIFMAMPEPKGFASNWLVEAFRFSNAVAFVSALLTALLCFGLLQFLSTWRVASSTELLHPWVAQLCVRMPYEAIWWLFILTLISAGLGLIFGTLYTCRMGFALGILIVAVIAGLVGARVLTMYRFFTSAAADCYKRDIYELPPPPPAAPGAVPAAPAALPRAQWDWYRCW